MRVVDQEVKRQAQFQALSRRQEEARGQLERARQQLERDQEAEYQMLRENWQELEEQNRLFRRSRGWE